MGSVCVGGLEPGLGIDAALGACSATGAAPQALDGFGDLTGDNYDDVGVGFNLGVNFEVSKQTKIGVAYRSEIEINVEGDADFTVPAGSTALDTVIAGSGGLFDDTDLEAVAQRAVPALRVHDFRHRDCLRLACCLASD